MGIYTRVGLVIRESVLPDANVYRARQLGMVVAVVSGWGCWLNPSALRGK